MLNVQYLLINSVYPLLIKIIEIVPVVEIICMEFLIKICIFMKIGMNYELITQ